MIKDIIFGVSITIKQTKSEAHTITGCTNNMARTIRTKVYKFNELSQDAKNKVIEHYRNINVDYDQWHEPIIEGAKEDLIAAGYINPTIYYSGFSSQGDGACFTCDAIDFNVFLNGKYAHLELTCDISHSYHYYFATSSTVNLYANDDTLVNDDLFTKIENDIKKDREKQGNTIYKNLEQYYDDLTVDIEIISTIEANDYEFTKEGNRFN